jgi:hypothetical protein
MSADIFDFWGDLPGGTKVHPADTPIFDRISNHDNVGHGFDLRCLPAPFAGALRTAPVVLLYLSAGFAEQDLIEADDPAAQARQARQRQGDAPLPTQDEYATAWTWWASRTKPFGDLNTFRDRIAFLNIGAYHSRDFQDYPLFSALPSCRASVGWAQTVLFPQAEAGERVVLCLRSAQFWGLEKGRNYHGSLFAPPVTRSGHMLRQGEAAPLYDKIITAVAAACLR